ncbi:MAG: glycosyltransferase family 4 protein, partial [Thermoanaerobaculia bacterium]|nr:glycosyltransferase family 4 protein [Thermoanaerobaculia bacterium]
MREAVRATGGGFDDRAPGSERLRPGLAEGRRASVGVVLSGYGVVRRGAETMLEELLPRLAGRFELSVYSRSGAGPGGVRRPAVPRQVVEPLYLANRWLRKTLDTLFLDPVHLEWTTHLLLSLPALARRRHDVIWHETGLWGGRLLAGLRRLTGVRLLDVGHGNHPGWEVPFARRRPDVYVALTEGFARQIRERVPGLRVEVVPQGVDCDRFRPSVAPLELGVEPPIALAVGALSPEKSPELVVEAAARAGVSAVFAGGGPLAERLDRRAAERLGPRRYRRLLLPRAEMPGLYAAADVVVLASPVESAPLSVLEALACGRPVVGAADVARV